MHARPNQDGVEDLKRQKRQTHASRELYMGRGKTMINKATGGRQPMHGTRPSQRSLPVQSTTEDQPAEVPNDAMQGGAVRQSS